jgi:hypothetical protein
VRTDQRRNRTAAHDHTRALTLAIHTTNQMERDGWNPTPGTPVAPIVLPGEFLATAVEAAIGEAIRLLQLSTGNAAHTQSAHNQHIASYHSHRPAHQQPCAAGPVPAKWRCQRPRPACGLSGCQQRSPSSYASESDLQTQMNGRHRQNRWAERSSVEACGSVPGHMLCTCTCVSFSSSAKTRVTAFNATLDMR